MFAFISYATADLAWANRLRTALEINGLSAFVADQHWRVGQPTSVFDEQIGASHLFILVWSDAARQSTWVPHECGVSSGARVPRVVFSIEPEVPLPEPLRGTRYADAKKDPFQAMSDIQGVAIARFNQVVRQQNADAQAMHIAQLQAQQQKSEQLFAGLVIGGIAAALLTKGK